MIVETELDLWQMDLDDLHDMLAVLLETIDSREHPKETAKHVAGAIWHSHANKTIEDIVGQLKKELAKHEDRFPGHTPGPWNTEGEVRISDMELPSDRFAVPIHANGYLIGYWVPTEWDGACPDADLIAAAPSLLEQ